MSKKEKFLVYDDLTDEVVGYATTPKSAKSLKSSFFKNCCDREDDGDIQIIKISG